MEVLFYDHESITVYIYIIIYDHKCNYSLFFTISGFALHARPIIKQTNQHLKVM